MYVRVCTYICMGWGKATVYSEASLFRHSMGPENNVGLGGCWIMECLLPYSSMVTVPHIMVVSERMLDYRGIGLERFHCIMYDMSILIQCARRYIDIHDIS